MATVNMIPMEPPMAGPRALQEMCKDSHNNKRYSKKTSADFGFKKVKPNYHKVRESRQPDRSFQTSGDLEIM